jgi:putative ABC transport system ATP-binding protein
VTLPISAQHITKTVSVGGNDQPILHAVSLQVTHGEFVGLVGPSGCGKTTLLNIIGLAEERFGGELLLDGVVVQGAHGSRLTEQGVTELRRSKVGYLFQYFNLLSTLTVVENVMLPMLLQGEHPESAQERAQALLKRVGLGQKCHMRPYTLSGGEMQRVAFARAIAHRPVVVLADEPTGNLDSQSGAVVVDLLAELVRDGIAVLMATHSDTAVKRCSRIVCMRDGRIE